MIGPAKWTSLAGRRCSSPLGGFAVVGTGDARADDWKIQPRG